jgi:branched-chain amino acid transport system permease protein
MSYFLQQLINGLTLGGVYALIALGYTLVYGVLQILNFAHGDVYMVGAFIGYFVMIAFGGPVASSIPVPLMIFLMFAVSMLGTGVLGVVIEKFAYRPLRNSSRIAPLISALGVSILLQNAALLIFGSTVRTYDTPSYIPSTAGFAVGDVTVDAIRLMVLILSLILMFALGRWVNKTQVGRAMRAIAVDKDAAVMMGIDIDKVIRWTFFVSAALAGAAGIMNGLLLRGVSNGMGFIPGLKGFTAAVLGGIGSIPGAMLGGLVLGVLEAMTQGYLSTNFSDTYTFILLIAIMLIRPNGLLGKKMIRKA